MLWLVAAVAKCWPQLSGDQLAPVETGDTGDSYQVVERDTTVVINDIQDHLGHLQSLLCYIVYFSLL